MNSSRQLFGLKILRCHLQRSPAFILRNRFASHNVARFCSTSTSTPAFSSDQSIADAASEFDISGEIADSASSVLENVASVAADSAGTVAETVASSPYTWGITHSIFGTESFPNFIGMVNATSFLDCPWYLWPGYVVQNGINLVHVTTGLPWWASMVSYIVVARLILLPLHHKSQLYAAISQKYSPVMQAMMNAAKEKSRNDGSKMIEYMCRIKTWKEKRNMNMSGSMKWMAPQVLIYGGFFVGVRSMGERYVEWTQGGALWWTNLSVCDPTYCLAALAGGSMFGLITMMQNQMQGLMPTSANPNAPKSEQVMQELMGNYMKLVRFIGPIGIFMSGATSFGGVMNNGLLVTLILNNTIMCLQYSLTNSNWYRTKYNLPSIAECVKMKNKVEKKGTHNTRFWFKQLMAYPPSETGFMGKQYKQIKNRPDLAKMYAKGYTPPTTDTSTTSQRMTANELVSRSRRRLRQEKDLKNKVEKKGTHNTRFWFKQLMAYPPSETGFMGKQYKQIKNRPDLAKMYAKGYTPPTTDTSTTSQRMTANELVSRSRRRLRQEKDLKEKADEFES
eukprot:173414_1